MSVSFICFATGLCAGAMNALAGGGSFVTLPVLLALGVPAVAANASSTVALLPGGLASTWAFRHGFSSVGSASLRPLACVTFCGGAVGALVLLHAPQQTFEAALPYLLLVADLALIFGRQLGAYLRHCIRLGPTMVLVIQGALGIYGGYFGGAVGIMMIATWGLLYTCDLKHMSANRALLVTLSNTAAVAIFLCADDVQWGMTLPLLVGAMIGGWVGARLSLRAPAPLIRTATVYLTSTITLIFLLRSYL